MTGTSIVMSRSELDTLEELGNLLLTSGYFNDVGKVAQAAVKVLAGRELGLGPVAAMRSLHIVDGKVQLSADLLAQRVKLHPRYDYRVERLDAEACVIRFFEDGAACGVSEFTMGDAANAGLLGKKAGTWERYPRNLLFARAMSNGVSWFAPDVASGGAFVVDGGVTVDTATGEIIEVSSEIEPGDGSADTSSVVGMVEDDGSSANARNTGAAADDPTREPLAYGEGAGDSTGEAEGPPSASPETSDPPAPAGGNRETQGVESGPGYTPPVTPGSPALAGGSAERALSSQTTQLLRHAAELRWNDTDIAEALEDAYPGMSSLRELDQEQARELIRVWAKLAAANRITKDQKERLKPLGTPAERVAAAQLLFGADHIRTVSDMTATEADAVIEHLEGVRAEQAVSA